MTYLVAGGPNVRLNSVSGCWCGCMLKGYQTYLCLGYLKSKLSSPEKSYGGIPDDKC